ncbi:MAG: hypothetical protein NTV81_02520 [Candidatus Komeilibacteria bacterium]|nr:hypothetical protein [Candidatus Komeilibacteria bacterium]
MPKIERMKKIEAVTSNEDLAQKISPKLAELVDGFEELPNLDPALVRQLNQYIIAEHRAHGDRARLGNGAEQKRWKELAMTYFKLRQFIYSRDLRVEDIESPEVQEAIDIKRKMFPFGVPKLWLCIDGRVLSKLVAGLHGNALRTPAADNQVEFLPRRGGIGLFLKKDGTFARMIQKVFRDKEAFGEEPIIFEVLDSHLKCAAGGLHAEEKHGHEAADHGLLDDVRRKKAMGLAIRQFVAEKYNGAKQVKIMQISFDPHTGFCFVGLEKEECLTDPRVAEAGYTEAVLSELVKEGKILSTQQLADSVDDPFFSELFLRFHFDVNYELNYRHSTNALWKNIQAMSPEALPRLEALLVGIYPKLKEADKSAELRQQAIFLLANMYNAFLHNHEQDYPYQEHEESVIAITYSEKGPFDRARSFSINPENPQLSEYLKLGWKLVQGNRRSGQMSPMEQRAVKKLYPKNDDYVNNPVLVSLFERTDEALPMVEVEKLRAVDWSDLPEVDWQEMSDTEFVDHYLNKKLPGIAAVVAEKINILRHRAIKLHKPGLPATEALLDGNLLPIWTLSGPDRKTIALFPFLTSGYSEATEASAA